jgi:hypothetical protein
MPLPDECEMRTRILHVTVDAAMVRRHGGYRVGQNKD